MTTEFGGALDAHLEAPYVQRAQDEADYEAWCEQQGLDPGEDHWDEYTDARDDEYEARYGRYHGNEDTPEGYDYGGEDPPDTQGDAPEWTI